MNVLYKRLAYVCESKFVKIVNKVSELLTWLRTGAIVVSFSSRVDRTAARRIAKTEWTSNSLKL